MEEQEEKDPIEENFEDEIKAIRQEDNGSDAEHTETSNSLFAVDDDEEREAATDDSTNKLSDIEALGEEVAGISDSVTALHNDNNAFLQQSQERFDDIETKLVSIMSSLHELSELVQGLTQVEDKMNENLSSNITNLQGALNQLNESTGQCVKELSVAADEIPKKLLDDCTAQNKLALDTAVANFNAMNAACQKWLKNLGNYTEWASQIVLVSGVLTPFLLLLLIIYIYFKL